jgi:hypothetical protein
VTAAADSARQRQVLAQLGLVRYRLRTPQAGADARGDADVALEVSAPGSRSLPVAGDAAAVWAKVLAWLGLAPDEVRWRERGGVVLPAVADWSGPNGKRGLWLALKGWRRRPG